MLLTIIPLGLEVISLVLVLSVEGPFGVAETMILALAMIVKLLCCVFCAGMGRTSRGRIRGILLIVCAGINAAVIMFSATTGAWRLMIHHVLLVILLAVWSVMAVRNSRVWGKKE